MLYSLKENYIDFRLKIRDWAKNNIVNNDEKFLSKDLFNSLKENKISGFHSPKSFGGYGKDFLYHVIAMEELSKINPYISLSIITNYLFELNLLNYGNTDQIINYLHSVQKCEKFSCVAILDKQEDFDIKNISTYAEKTGDYYILNGHKFCHSNVDYADYFLIFAKIKSNDNDNFSSKNENIAAFIVENNFDGCSINCDEKNKLCNQGYIHLDNVKIPKENLLGNETDGYDIAISTLVNSHLSLSSHFLGLSQNLYNKIRDYQEKNYTNENIFDSISKFITNIEAGKMIIYSAAELRNNGYKAIRESAMANLYNSKLTKTIIEFMSENDAIIEAENIDIKSIYDFNFNNIYTSDIEKISQIINRKNNKKFDYTLLESSFIKKTEIQRKKIIFNSINPEKNVDNLLKYIKDDLKINKTNNFDIYSDIEKSDTVVSFGLGIGDRDNIKKVEKFSKLISASIASTLPIAEELEWIDTDRAVGINGKSFTGKLYFALGLSGDEHHIKGIIDAETIIAINIDKHANIFSYCDYGIIGDVNKIISILINKLKN